MLLFWDTHQIKNKNTTENMLQGILNFLANNADKIKTVYDVGKAFKDEAEYYDSKNNTTEHDQLKPIITNLFIKMILECCSNKNATALTSIKDARIVDDEILRKFKDYNYSIIFGFDRGLNKISLKTDKATCKTIRSLAERLESTSWDIKGSIFWRKELNRLKLLEYIDDERTIEELKKAAYNGDIDAMIVLGDRFSESSPEWSTYWYNRATKEGKS